MCVCVCIGGGGGGCIFKDVLLHLNVGFCLYCTEGIYIISIGFLCLSFQNRFGNIRTKNNAKIQLCVVHFKKKFIFIFENKEVETTGVI